MTTSTTSPIARPGAGAVLAGALAAATAASGQLAEPFAPDPAAAKAFAEVLASYRARPALGVKSTLKIELQQGDLAAASDALSAEMTWTRRPRGGPEGRVVINGYDCRFRAGQFVAVHEGKDDAYYKEEYEGSPYWLFLINFKDIPYPHLALFWGEAAPEEVWMQLQPASPSIVPTKVEQVDADGATYRRIELSSPHATLELLVDPATSLIRAIEHEITGGHTVQPGTTKRTTYTFEYTPHDAPLPEETFALDPGARHRVDLLTALLPAPEAQPVGGGPGADLVGRAAPPLVLATADGGAVDLAELRGKVVVLDFWATWCGPCRRALPGLHEVAAWAREEALPVAVLTVNVWEVRGNVPDDPDARLESVRAFWERQGYTLPVAMDYTDEVAAAYGVTAIPATFVIRSDGIVHAQPGPGEDGLKRAILDAIAALESVDAPQEP